MTIDHFLLGALAVILIIWALYKMAVVYSRPPECFKNPEAESPESCCFCSWFELCDPISEKLKRRVPPPSTYPVDANGTSYDPRIHNSRFGTDNEEKSLNPRDECPR